MSANDDTSDNILGNRAAAANNTNTEETNTQSNSPNNSKEQGTIDNESFDTFDGLPINQ